MKKLIFLSAILFLIPTIAFAWGWNDFFNFFAPRIESEPQLSGSVIYPYAGGTGTSTTPIDLKLLVGRGNGSYDLKTLTAGANITISTSTGVLTITGISTADGSSNWNFSGVNAIKPTSTVGIIVSASSTLAGDLTVGNEDLFVDISENKVAISTTSPRYTLDVWGSFAVGTSTATTSNAIIPAFLVSTGSGPQIGIGTSTLSNNLLTVGTTSPALVVDTLSRVGISTSTPSAQFAVKGDIMGSGNLVIYDTTATSTLKGGLTVGNNAALVVNQAASANSLYIAANGNVGIATTSPRYKLDVWGDFSVGTTTIYGGANMPLLYVDSGNGAGKIGIATSTPRYSLDVWGSLAIGSTTASMLLVDAGNSLITIGSDMSVGSLQIASSSGAITLVDMIVEASASAGTEESYAINLDASSTPTTIFYGESDGVGGIRNQRVGIATTTPAVRLDVNGLIRAYQTSTTTCSATLGGAIFFNQTDNRGYMCDKTIWQPLW